MNKIIYSSPYIPPEWIAAHDLLPIRLTPALEVEDIPIPDNEGVCPFMRRFVNESAHSNPSAIILTTTCDQMRKADDFIKTETNIPVFLMNVPSTWKHRESLKLYISELKRLGTFLTALGGKNPSDAKITETMLEYENKHSSRKSGIFQEDAVPIALMGGPLSKQDYELIDLINNSGGYIALDGTEEGERTRPALFDKQKIKEAPLKELANAYFGTIPDAFRRPNSQLYTWLEQKIKEREIKGILFLRYVWCDIWHAEVQRMKDCLDVPLIDIDLNDKTSIARNSTRIQAFMETLR